MLTKKDLLLISLNYFEVLMQTKYYVEVLSKSTGHCWTIYKHGSPDKYSIWIYHKHSKKDMCYHLHRKKGTMTGAIKEILQHDQYILSGRQNMFCN